MEIDSSNMKNIPHECVIKGDGKYLPHCGGVHIGKTYRDEFMEKIHEEYPAYDWKKK